MTNTWSSGNIKVLEIDKHSELESQKQDDFDIVLINEPVDELYQYPTKIIFEMEVPNNLEEYIGSFESSKRSSIRKRIRTTNENLEATILDPMDEKTFAEWEEGYKSFIESLGEGHNYINADWLKESGSTHFGIFFINKVTGKMEGGSLIKRFLDIPKLSMSFAWYSDLAKELGASTALMCKLIDYSTANNLKIISFGQDTNIYGGHLSLGLEEFKTGWGAVAKPAKKAEIKSAYIVKPIKNKFKFYYFEDNILKLYKSYE